MLPLSPIVLTVLTRPTVATVARPTTIVMATVARPTTIVMRTTTFAVVITVLRTLQVIT